MLLLVGSLLAVLVGIPASLLVVGFKRHRRSHSIGAKVIITAGTAICLAYLLAIGFHVITVGPYKSGVLAQGNSPSGSEYCVVQTYKAFGLIGEPYQVSFYMRDTDRVWRWQYLAHQDNAWRDLIVTFNGSKARVSHRGYPVRELPLPTGSMHPMTMREGEDYLPASYSVEDVLKWHNTKFKD